MRTQTEKNAAKASIVYFSFAILRLANRSCLTRLYAYHQKGVRSCCGSVTCQLCHGYNSATTYQSQSPSRAYFLIVNATFKNTGADFTASRLDWAIRNIDGFLIDFPASTFYAAIAFVKGETQTHTIVFDLTTYADPAKISLDLPNGKMLNAAL